MTDHDVWSIPLSGSLKEMTKILWPYIASSESRYQANGNAGKFKVMPDTLPSNDHRTSYSILYLVLVRVNNQSKRVNVFGINLIELNFLPFYILVLLQLWK